jgi:hypothetical protein
MNREIWEFLAKGSSHVIREWVKDERITRIELAKLDFALNQLRTLDYDLVSRKLLAGPLRGALKLYKLRIRCANRELRPLLCRGPFARFDYTLLAGAIEEGDRLRPSDAYSRAQKNLETLERNSHWREIYRHE